MDNLLVPIGLSLVSFSAGTLLFWLYQRIKLGEFRTLGAAILKEAEQKAESLRQKNEWEMKQRNLEREQDFIEQRQKEKKALQQEEERLKLREDKLEARYNTLEKKFTEIEKKEVQFTEKEQTLHQLQNDLQKRAESLTKALSQTAHMTIDEAKQELLDKLANELKSEHSLRIRQQMEELNKEGDLQAQRVIVTAIQRLASSTVSEATVATVSLPSDEMKGRIIGREGRNIRALEKATGATFLMDDTPQTIVISCFDPVRRAIAKNVLVDLIQDGRIHPTRIEEALEKASQQIERQIHQFGQDAALRAGAPNLHQELIVLLGRLKFRYSYGQNVLDHSLEVSHLMGLMAGELGLDVALARRIGLLHDVGKAVTHEIQGTHALIGRDLATKYGESKEVANGIGCHHNEINAITLEGSLCSAADAISAARPGARIDAVEEYVQRLAKLEELASNYPGVEKAYALQAGREIRIMVHPDQVQDHELLPLARSLTKKIETELVYPGKIKISLFREKRVVDYAM
jgi:ribonuclease Y